MPCGQRFGKTAAGLRDGAVWSPHSGIVENELVLGRLTRRHGDAENYATRLSS
jgi:hypothetical protein